MRSKDEIKEELEKLLPKADLVGVDLESVKKIVTKLGISDFDLSSNDHDQICYEFMAKLDELGFLNNVALMGGYFND